MYQAAAATTMTAAAMATTATVEAAMITPPVSPAQDRRNPMPSLGPPAGATGPAGPGALWALEPLTGPSIHADWLGQRGEGFHHVGYVVRSLDQTTAEMEAAGHPVIARIHSLGADGDGAAAYYDTADALGFLLEAFEAPVRMPPTDFTL
jgi:Glyoxalase/Bleomycin resistance protein/Dioxygenase superfamily